MTKEKFSKHVHVARGALHGWCDHCSDRSRHRALNTTVRIDGYATTVRRLNYLSNVANRKNNARLHDVARRDVKWLHGHRTAAGTARRPRRRSSVKRPRRTSRARR